MKGNMIAAVFLLLFGAVIAWVIWNGTKSNASLAGAAAGERTLMDFQADWCGPCQMMKPVVKELAGELQGRLQVVEVNVDESPDLAREYHIRSIPCFVVLENGREVARETGVLSKERLRELTGL